MARAGAVPLGFCALLDWRLNVTGTSGLITIGGALIGLSLCQMVKLKLLLGDELRLILPLVLHHLLLVLFKHLGQRHIIVFVAFIESILVQLLLDCNATVFRLL